MTANMDEWKRLLDKTGVAYETTKCSIDFLVKGQRNGAVRIWFKGRGAFLPGVFEKIELFETDRKAKELVSPTANVYDWTEILDKCKIYYAHKKFSYKGRWTSYWLEVPCNPGMILRISYGSPYNDPKVFALSIEAR